MRIFILSDLHVDYARNRAWIDGLSQVDFRADVLICAGDISHKRSHLEWTLDQLKERFARLFFVPGNHDLWLDDRAFQHSLAKWHWLKGLCQGLGVDVAPAPLGAGEPWVVPLLSWYTLPGAGEDSLAMGAWPQAQELALWSDSRWICWPPAMAAHPAAALAALNELPPTSAAAVISVSHFLPRRELVPACFPSFASGALAPPRRRFNFSWVAGSALIEAQLRRLNATLHVYGHQHRNRRRCLDGVLYLAHCLGYPRERDSGAIAAAEAGPLAIWDNERGGLVVAPWDGDHSSMSPA